MRGIAATVVWLLVLGAGAAEAALSERDTGLCAEEAAALLPKIPALTVTKVDRDDSDKAKGRALDAAGYRSALAYTATQWSDKLISGGYETVTADEAAKIRSLARSGNQDGGAKIIDQAIRRGVEAAGDRAGVVTLTYTAGAIKGAKFYACVYPGDRALVVPLGRAD